MYAEEPIEHQREPISPETADGRHAAFEKQAREIFIVARLLSCVTPGEERTIRQAYGLHLNPRLEDVQSVSSPLRILRKLRKIVRTAET